MEANYPHAIKNQRGASKIPPIGVFCVPKPLVGALDATSWFFMAQDCWRSKQLLVPVLDMEVENSGCPGVRFTTLLPQSGPRGTGPGPARRRRWRR